MNAQLEGLSTGEIRALIDEAHEVLAHRNAADHEQRLQEKEANRGEGGSWLEHEMVSCGKCARCLSGERAHGPYWYLYRYTGARMVSSYIGRRLPEELASKFDRPDLVGFGPEEAFPDSYSKIGKQT